jgi:ABC-2 type transport system ATP-binding protein
MKIEVKNVTKRFKDNVILEDVNLEFVGGKIYGLIGRNGSGKSVLLKMLCAFYEPSSGEILYDGENIIKEEKYPPSTRALIEKPAFIPDLTGKQNLLLLASIQNIIGEKEIDSTMERLGLVPNDNKKYYKYSLGMKQKLGIAQVLMENPDVIILDEPINALDDSGTEQVRQILMKHKQRGALIIIACHDADELEFLSDEIIEIAEGKIQPKKDKKSNKQ